MDAYEGLRIDSYVYDMLFEGEREAEASEIRLSPKEALVSMRAVLLRENPSYRRCIRDSIVADRTMGVRNERGEYIHHDGYHHAMG